MTKKNYIRFASILGEYIGQAGKGTIDADELMHELVEDIAAYFAEDNPRFNYDAFRDEVYGKNA